MLLSVIGVIYPPKELERENLVIVDVKGCIKSSFKIIFGVILLGSDASEGMGE